MPAVETWLVATPKARADSFDNSPDSPSKNHENGQDFASVMQATLGPAGQSAFAKKAPQIQKNSVKVSVTESFSPSTIGNSGSTGLTDTGKSQTCKKSDKPLASPDSSTGSDAASTTSATQPPEPPPSIFSLPYFFTVATPAITNPSFAKSDADGTAQNPGMALTDSIGAIASSSTKSEVLGSGANNLPLAQTAVADTFTPGKLSSTKDAGGNLTQTLPSTGLADELKPSPVDSSGSFKPAPVHSETPKEISHLTMADENTLAILAKSDAQAGLNVLPAPITPIPSDKEAFHRETNVDSANGLQMGASADTSAGTGVADMGSLMKNLQKTNKVAGLDAKVLPVGQNGQASGNNLPQLPVTPVRSAENHGTDLNFAFSNGNNHPVVADHVPVLNTLDLPSLADARIRALDRTHDMMALHSMRLVESKSDMLSVVIKPTVGTELTLELRQGPDGVKAQATLTRGDHQFFTQHWTELQQKLEQRGIKLAPLAGEGNFWANSNGQFRQQQQTSPEDAAQQASAFAEFAVATTQTGGATAKLATGRDGWESWA